MKTLYLNLGMGAAGDMLTAALYELLTPEEKEQALKALADLQIPGVEFIPERSEKCGIVGTHMSVMIRGIEESEETVAQHPAEQENGQTAASMKLNLPDAVRAHFREVYRIIGKAESKAHGVPVKQIHFHEVGELDAVADIAAACLLMEMIRPEQVIASAVNTGRGQVRCAHGIMPVPTPATANILKGIPIYSNQIMGELCTPTGAALVRHFVDSFGPMPEMVVSRIGYGMGKKDFEAANCIVAMLGETVR